MRRPYLDNIRWGTVVLVMLYHVLYIFNASGVLGGVGSFYETQYWDIPMYLVYPWFMVLLFLVSGICARYALMRRTHGQFIGERTRKLLVPSTIGVFVLQWLVGYFNAAAAAGWDAILEKTPEPIRPVMVYVISALSGTGPLWFAHLLWLYSLLLVLVRLIDRRDKVWEFCGRANIPVLILLCIPLWASSLILNVPVVTVYRVGIYGFSFFLGYFIFSHEQVQARTEKMCIPALIAAIGLGTVFTFLHFGSSYADAAVLESPLTNAFVWAAVLAVLGCSRKWLNHSNRFADYMTSVSFGLYVLHYLPLIVCAYLAKRVLLLPALPSYLLVTVGTFLLTPLLYELIRRIPVLRWCVLGIRRRSKPSAPNT